MSQFEQKLQSLSVRKAFMDAIDRDGATKSFEAMPSAATIEIDSQTVGTNSAFDALSGSTAFVMKQLTETYEETRTQAKAWFRFSMIAAVIGFLVIGAGAVMAMMGQTTQALITAISSIVPAAISTLFFAQSRSANERIDQIVDKLNDAREILTLVDIVNTVESQDERTRLKAEIVRKALALQS